ncbi:hypothetical protein ABZ281_02600 [Streptomyces sp. NPDC006265]|uniref:hypothetical protein n=1 Tax=Streptomyces sp. NPDC006265 TaxID=3156740 RepID=UPI0033B65A62
MTQGIRYSAEEWREALNRAGDLSFCEIDSREQAGELAGVTASLYEDEAEKDEDRLYAAITVAGGLAEEFDQDFLTAVLRGHDNNAGKGLAERAKTFVEQKWPGFPFEEIEHPDRFAARHTLQKHERWASSQEGDYDGFVFVFDVSELAQGPAVSTE